jgi:cell division protein FtsL
MKKILFILVFTIPVLLFFNVWQVYRHDQVKDAVSALEEQQREWLERNKRMIAGIAVLRSPTRIDKLAKEELELEKIESGRLLRINFTDKRTGKGSDDG